MHQQCLRVARPLGPVVPGSVWQQVQMRGAADLSPSCCAPAAPPAPVLTPHVHTAASARAEGGGPHRMTDGWVAAAAVPAHTAMAAAAAPAAACSAAASEARAADALPGGRQNSMAAARAASECEPGRAGGAGATAGRATTAGATCATGAAPSAHSRVIASQRCSCSGACWNGDVSAGGGGGCGAAGGSGAAAAAAQAPMSSALRLARRPVSHSEGARPRRARLAVRGSRSEEGQVSRDGSRHAPSNARRSREDTSRGG
mmetsp:Transcript_25496/g.64695  ORF Transcript_25496/g.64695 Transcript_25496/m.64695 type:complete len:259 (+) Transcript_25496:1260-2036(+)